MKQFYQLLQQTLLIAACLLWPYYMDAYDFKATNENGITIYYNIDGNNAIVTSGDETYTGELKIPSTVEYNSKTFSVTAIGDNAFYFCSGLKAINIPASITSIGNFAFAGCAGIESLTLSEGLTTIGYGSFQSCNNLTSIVIPTSVTKVETNAFASTNALSSITVKEGNAIYDSRNDCNAIIETATNTLVAGCKTTLIPNGITTIGNGAFNECKDLLAINLPSTIKSIDENAFYFCSGLKAINIPASVTSIGNFAFAGCADIESLTLSEGLTTIGYGSFQNCKVLSTIKSHICNPFEIESNVFDREIKASAKLIVPVNSKSKYGNTLGWDFANIVEAKTAQSEPYVLWCNDNATLYFTNSSDVYTIGTEYKGHTITNVWSGVEITETGSKAPHWNSIADNVIHVVFDESFKETTPTSTCAWFVKFKQLEDISGLSHLNTSKVENMLAMFGMCSKLETLDLKNFNTSKVTDMSWMFYGCNSLKKLDLSHFNTANTRQMDMVFGDCHSLEELNISGFNTEKVSSFRRLFYNCNSLKSVDISSFDTGANTSLTNMFYGCNSLTEIDLSSFDTSNTEECDSMFHNCSSLKSIKFGNFNLTKATGLRHMFCGCNSLTELDLSNFKTEHIKYMDFMFNGCNLLRTIYVGEGWSIKNVISSNRMFQNCYNLIGGNGTTYENIHMDAAYARVDTDGVPGYFSTLNEVGIGAIQKQQGLQNAWSTLGGMILEKRPTQKGVYLHDGEKVFIK